jgi:meiotically up-regulated gene 157 (Mug157) protein
MDDANVPSLLSIPYLGYRSPHDPDGRIANNTRRFVLSRDNPHYYAGAFCLSLSFPLHRIRCVLQLLISCHCVCVRVRGVFVCGERDCRANGARSGQPAHS